MQDEANVPDRSPRYSMYAAVYHEYGNVDEVVVTEVLKPKMRRYGILVRVKFAGVNPADLKFLRGQMSLIQQAKALPCIPGYDFSGVVEEVDEGCQRIKVGDRVYGMQVICFGAIAEYVVVEERLVSIIPENMGFKEAAALPCSALSAYQSLIKPKLVNANSRLLIIGGSGGTGHLALKLAKTIGAHVTVVCSTDNIEFVKSLGADEVVDYKAGDIFTQLSTLIEINEGASENTSNSSSSTSLMATKKLFDVIFDTVGVDDRWAEFQTLLSSNGHFCTINPVTIKDGVTVSSLASIVSTVISRKFWSFINTPAFHALVVSSNYQDLDAVGQFNIVPHISSVFPLTTQGVRAAFSAVDTTHTRGKIVIDISSIPEPESNL